MSAYIVDHGHIDALLTFATDNPNGTVSYFIDDTRVEITPANATEIGRILLTENEHSVRQRYPDSPPDDLPGSIGDDAARYDFQVSARLAPLVILKACDCFDYQACETDDYASSLAYRIVDAIRHRAISLLPGYENSPGWDIQRPERVETPTRLDRLKEVFARNLAQTLADDPSYFAWKADELPTITTKMLAAIDKAGGVGGINIKSRTFERTAKEFGIKNTFKAWAAWLAESDAP